MVQIKQTQAKVKPLYGNFAMGKRASGPVIPNRLAALNAKMKAPGAGALPISSGGGDVSDSVGVLRGRADHRASAASALTAGYFGHGSKLDPKMLYPGNDSLYQMATHN